MARRRRVTRCLWSIRPAPNPGIGSADSFFEFGGNTLLLTQLLAQIRKTFRLELSLTSLFERLAIADTAKLIEETRAAHALAEAEEEDREVREQVQQCANWCRFLQSIWL